MLARQRSCAPSPLTGYVPDMSNPFDITLDSAWIEWAAKEKVSETVAAAVLLIWKVRQRCQAR
jgi:hypothetical protein